MFENLLESKPKKERSLAQSIVSIIVHVVLIIGAIKATQAGATVVSEKVTSAMAFMTPPPPPPPPPPPETPPPQTVAKVPPPQGFQTLVPPKEIPTAIPPVNLNDKFDARNYSGIGQSGGTFNGVIGGTPQVIDAVNAETYSSDQVDDPAAYLDGPPPKYPKALQAAGVQGVVTLEFVVGIDGKAESATIKVVKTSNERFNDSAIETIKSSKFKPAKNRGQPVRQLVTQNVNFTIGG